MLGQLDEAQIDYVLRSEVVGHLGCCHEGRAYVVPITYAYDGESVYAHSIDGMKVHFMRANPTVCFEVEHIDNMANWQSVIAWGDFEELHGADADQALRRIESRLLSLIVSETAESAHGRALRQTYQAKTGGLPAVVYRLRLRERTGRFEREYGLSAVGARSLDHAWSLML